VIVPSQRGEEECGVSSSEAEGQVDEDLDATIPFDEDPDATVPYEEEDLDETVPYDEEPNEESAESEEIMVGPVESEDTESDSESEPEVRRSSRVKRPSRGSSYEQLGEPNRE
jgi:hypothetical protein